MSRRYSLSEIIIHSAIPLPKLYVKKLITFHLIAVKWCTELFKSLPTL